MIVPAGWLPFCKVKRIINHWTGGNYKASAYDKSHYHILVEDHGANGARLERGVPIEKNAAPVKNGYAAHTLNCNTDSIGVSLCGMAGSAERPFKPGRAPFTKAQWDLMVRANADLCRFYKIPVTAKTVLTHAEVQANLGIRQRFKWDIAILPFEKTYDTAREVGDRLRAEVSALLKSS